MKKINGIKLVLAALLSLSLASCALDTNAPYAPSTTAHGTVSSSNASSYFYPHVKGYTYAYTNTFRSYDRGADQDPTTTVGTSDTVKTLGYQGSTSTGDSLFAISVKYEVLSSYQGRPKMPLRYVPQSSGFVGAFVNNSQTVGGEVTALSPNTRAASVDSIMGAAAGRIRMIADDYSSNGTRLWQTDTVYFSGNGDSVYQYQKDGQGNWIRSRTIFCRRLSTGDYWNNATWNTATRYTVLNVDSAISLAGQNFQVTKIGVTSSNYNLPITEEKYFGVNTGLIKQFDSWYVTSDGSSATLQTLTREVGVVVIDPSEIL